MPNAPKQFRLGSAPKQSRKQQNLAAYSTRWKAYSKWRRQQPEEAVCALCERNATEVLDHVRAAGRAGSPPFWDESNHVGLCRQCHRTKTATCDGALGNAAGAKSKEILNVLIPEARRRWEMIQAAEGGNAIEAR